MRSTALRTAGGSFNSSLEGGGEIAAADEQEIDAVDGGMASISSSASGSSICATTTVLASESAMCRHIGTAV